MQKISVVIPALNEEDYLGNLLDDLAAQTLAPSQVIVADASTHDKTAAVARSYGATVTLGGTPPVGRNQGAAAATGDYLLFLDADVQLKNPRFIEDAIKLFVAKKLDIANFKFGNVGVRSVNLMYFWWNIGQMISVWIRRPYASGGGILVKRKVFTTLAGFDERLQTGEDLDIVSRSVKTGFRFGIIPLYIYPSPRRFTKVGILNVMLLYWVGTLLTVIVATRIYSRVQSYFQQRAGGWGEWEDA